MINVEEFFTAIEQLRGYKDNGKNTYSIMMKLIIIERSG